MRLAGTKLAANHQYRGFGDQLYDLSGTRPSLDLNFAATKSLTDSATSTTPVTFTRASSGTYVDSQGVIRTAANDVPRFDHNPTTGESLGLLVEETRTNLSQQSADFTDASWVKTDCTITANESTAPDGTLTADLWTNTGNPGIINYNIVKDAAVRTYTASLWVKGTTAQFTMSIDSGTGTNRGRAVFNISSGTLVSIFNDGNFTNTSGTITAYANGWYRLTVTTTTSTLTAIRFRFFFSNVGATARIWGAQVEEGAFVTSYIPTTTATATRSADVASITGSNFSSWYRQDEGTLYGDSIFAAINNTRIAGLSDSTISKRIVFSRGSGSNGNINMAVTDTTAQVSGLLFATALAAGTSNKVAAVYRANDFAGSVNGLAAVTQTTGTVPLTLTQLGIGTGEVIGNNTMTGTLKRLAYWPQRLPNNVLQSITQ